MGDSLDDKPAEKKAGSSWYHYNLLEVILIAIIPLVWVSSLAIFFLITKEPERVRELPSLLFGASSIALFGFSFLVALGAIFGWRQMKEYIDEQVRVQVANLKETSEQEMTGRIYSGMGFTLGRLSRQLDQLEPDRPDLLDAAILWTSRGLEKLAEINSNYTRIPKNNLAFYLGVRGKREDRGRTLMLRQEMLDGDGHALKTNHRLTCCLATLRYSTEAREREEALDILQEITESDKTTPEEKAEAQLYLDSNELHGAGKQNSESWGDATDLP